MPSSAPAASAPVNPAPRPGPTAAPTKTGPSTAAPTTSAPTDGERLDELVPQPSASPLPEASAPTAAAPAASDELALPHMTNLPALPIWWPWAAGGLGALALLGAALLLRRRRAPKILRLAAPPPGGERGDPPLSPPGPGTETAPNTLDVTLEITAATRSVMMFTLQYRIALANRSAQAVNGVSLAVALTCARHGANNAPSPGAGAAAGAG